MTDCRIILKHGREKSLLRRHPWIFSGAIDHVEGNPSPGDTVRIFSVKNEFLAQASFSPRSQIAARVWSFSAGDTIGSDFFSQRIREAVAMRESLFRGLDVNAMRLVHSESDGLPGVIVDRYGDFLVCQFLSTGAERWKETIADILDRTLHPAGIYERSDADVRRKEGLPPCNGLMAGSEPPEHVTIREYGLSLPVDIRQGHKTGFYLDQRENRLRLRHYCAGKSVLNCFCYTGGFSLHALSSGAQSVTSVDTSASALALIEKGLDMNRLNQENHVSLRGDVFQVLRDYRQNAGRFDLVVLDPPKFIESRMNIETAARGYKDINRLAFEILNPGGILFTFSCSGLMETDLFQKIVADAALDARREGFILERLFQAPDHGHSLAFPEGLYLKGLVVKVG